MKEKQIEKDDELSKLRKRIINKSEHSQTDNSFGDCSLLRDIQKREFNLLVQQYGLPK